MNIAPLAAFAALALPAIAQHVIVDNLGYGCQPGGPVLSGGMAASGTVDFEYLQATHVLRIVVANTSPVTAGCRTRSSRRSTSTPRPARSTRHR
jgi:hypothetical protein